MMSSVSEVHDYHVAKYVQVSVYWGHKISEHYSCYRHWFNDQCILPLPITYSC